MLNSRFHNLRRLRMQDEFTAFQPYSGMPCYAPTGHNPLDVFK